MKDGIDYIIEDKAVVFTEQYLINRGKCCGSMCKNCPFDEPYKKGNTNLKDNLKPKNIK